MDAEVRPEQLEMESQGLGASMGWVVLGRVKFWVEGGQVPVIERRFSPQ